MDPEIAAVAGEFREVFGEARLTRWTNGKESAGRPDPHVYATCFYKGTGQPIQDESTTDKPKRNAKAARHD